jgi:ribosome-associated toxin RatA of RatAB toxin-antitoxin module
MKAEQSREIAATPEACFKAICDFETYPQWQSAVRSCVVEERDAEGRGVLVDTKIDAKVKSVRYRLRYEYDPPHRASWTFIDGDVRDISGFFGFEPGRDGGCLATYSLDIDPGRFVPGPIKDVLKNVLMRGCLAELAKHVE